MPGVEVHLRRADGDGDADAIGLAARERRRPGDRPAAADPRERVRHVHPEEADVDQAVDVDEAARDELAIFLPHLDAVEAVELRYWIRLSSRDSSSRVTLRADADLARHRRFELRAHVVAGLFDRAEVGMPTSSPDVTVGPHCTCAYSPKTDAHDTGDTFRLTTSASSLRFDAQ